MNKKLKSVLTISILLSGIFITKYANADSISPKINNYKKMNEKELSKTLKALDKDQLLNDVNEISYLIPRTGFSSIAADLLGRVDEFSSEELIQEISDESNTEVFSEVLVELYNYKANTSKNTSKNNSELKGLLKDDKTKKSVKKKIILDSSFTKEDEPLLVELINLNDESLSSSSLKKLSKLNSQKAKEISTKLLSDSKTNERLISQSQESISKELKESKNKAEISSFIKETINRFNESTSQIVKDSAMYSLAELSDLDAFKSIINSDADKDLKVYAIDVNYKFIDQLLDNTSLSNNDLTFVLECMTILPINNAKSKLEAINKNVSYKDLSKQLNEVIKLIELNGMDANNKWNIK